MVRAALFFGTLHRVSVDRESDGRLRVSEHLGNGRHRHSTLDQQRRGRVAKVVEPKMADARRAWQ